MSDILFVSIGAFLTVVGILLAMMGVHRLGQG